ncbi:membrane dipeptidase [Virgibacillus halophilus]|uniref:Membrane dipeptidase n=1 Tax=Tigheibacillus halophilus TaxID=361280 RepID=A0ABU5C1X6_9BACI|nr:membrane dipeptidase [Virgibacillus halophilus]
MNSYRERTNNGYQVYISKQKGMDSMKIIDTHCDALLKLQLAKRGLPYGKLPLSFQHAAELETNLARLQQGSYMAQFFAIFIEPDVPSDEKWQHALEQIDMFHTEILDKHPEMKHMKSWEDFDRLQPGEIGAVLALEGADAFGNDFVKLRQLYREGILYMGMSWNNANLCADGAGEPRGGGLTELGKEVVNMNNANQVYTDVSHSTVKGFWDILELSDYPFASHANARAICDHPRNLYDEQIKAMFAKNGLIHLVYNPPFIKKGQRPSNDR